MVKSAIAAAPPLGQVYEVEGRRLALHRAGSGGPAVVFLPGAGLIGLDYLNLHEAISQRTVSVIYDRAGTGWSGEIALPRSAEDVARELRALLAAAGVAPPYILVGHSLGGAYIRRYAQLFPEDVAGLLFLDPAHEAYAGLPKPSFAAQVRQILAMAPALLDMKRFYRPMFEQMFRTWPEPMRGPLIGYHLRSWRKSLQEAANLQTKVLAEIRDGGGLPNVPLIVLIAMGLDPFMATFAEAADLRRLNDLKRGFYAAFAASARRGEARELPNAGHSTLHTDRPDAVIRAIEDLLAANPPAHLSGALIEN